MYPNPAISGNKIHMKFDNPNAERIAISVTNTSGKEIYEDHTAGNSLVIMPGKKWDAGLYVITIKSFGAKHQRKLIIIDKN
nr:T9SS type A sorting domain-containing protein [Fulvivirga marina]